MDQGPEVGWGRRVLVLAAAALVRFRLQRRGVVDEGVAAKSWAVVLRAAPASGKHLPAGDHVLGLGEHALAVRVGLLLNLADPLHVVLHLRLHV